MFRITSDPKHVGVIFSFMYFEILYNVDFDFWVLYNQVYLVG